jgi:hypothetical protein
MYACIYYKGNLRERLDELGCAAYMNALTCAAYMNALTKPSQSLNRALIEPA